MSKCIPRLIGLYQIGDCIGKGAFGKVYKALNIETGQIVAIKQISISDISEDQSKVIQKEINFMKRLSHKNIVKYIDVLTSDEFLNIVLEYIENGSLAGIVKKFNTIQESLVAVFIQQVLQGLKYLHGQGLVHRDIKGANLLTTKDGTVKLADFGVAMKLSESIKSMSIVGTPYWMAPEIVEQSGRCTTSCDIWSVGCTVIELLTGKPPYYDLEPMSALYRIVRDEYPPIPSEISAELQDFLIKCFQKEPLIRLSADDLLRHPWILKNQKKGDLELKENIYCVSPEKYSQKDSSFSQVLNDSSRQESVLVNSFKDSEDDLNDSFCGEIENIVAELDLSQSPKSLHKLLEVVSSNEGSKKNCKEALPILRQVLEESEETEVLHLALQITNLLCGDPEVLMQSACLGLLSSAIRFIGEDFSKELRIESAFLIGSLFQSSTSLHLFLSSGGIEATVKLIDPNFLANRELVIIGIDCLFNLLESAGKEYIRACASFGAIERLALSLDNLLNDKSYEIYSEKVADLLLVFSTGPLSVLFKFCEEDVLSIIVACIPSLPDHAKIQILNVLQNLSNNESLLNRLENAGFVVDLVKTIKNEEDCDYLTPCVLALNNMCRNSPARQEQAVLAGVVPVLMEYMNGAGKLAQVCNSLICSFTSTSVAVRSALHRHFVFQALLKVDPMPSQVFDAITHWISMDTSRCKTILAEYKATNKVG